MNIELSRAQFLSDCYTAGKYQGNWLLIPDPMEVVLQWMHDGTVAEISNRAGLYNSLKARLLSSNQGRFANIKLGIKKEDKK